jgi:hypothetical protein
MPVADDSLARDGAAVATGAASRPPVAMDLPRGRT